MRPWYRKSTDSWYVEIAGSQIRLGKTKAEATANLRQMLSAEGGTELDSPTAVQIITEWWDDYRRTRAVSTVDSRRRAVETFRESLPTSLLAVNIRPSHVHDWLETQACTKDSSINDRITLIKGIFKWTLQAGRIPRNPLAAMHVPRPSVRQEFVPSKKWKRLIDACPNDNLRDVVRFMLFTGCRAEELIRFEACHLQTAGRTGKLVLPISHSKGKRRSRTVYLSRPALRIAKRLSKKHKDGKLFRNTSGGSWNNGALNKAFERLSDATGIAGLCPTVLRHSFAHHRIRKGQDINIVAKLLGHSDTRMLMTRYGHLEDSNILEKEAQRYDS